MGNQKEYKLSKEQTQQVKNLLQNYTKYTVIASTPNEELRIQPANIRMQRPRIEQISSNNPQGSSVEDEVLLQERRDNKRKQQIDDAKRIVVAIDKGIRDSASMAQVRRQKDVEDILRNILIKKKHYIKDPLEISNRTLQIYKRKAYFFIAYRMNIIPMTEIKTRGIKIPSRMKIRVQDDFGLGEDSDNE